jgi:hypothetical protein
VGASAHRQGQEPWLRTCSVCEICLYMEEIHPRRAIERNRQAAGLEEPLDDEFVHISLAELGLPFRSSNDAKAKLEVKG